MRRCNDRSHGLQHRLNDFCFPLSNGRRLQNRNHLVGMIVDFGPKCGIAVVQKLITNRKVASANLPPPPPPCTGVEKPFRNTNRHREIERVEGGGQHNWHVN